jgi:hypothetical protein
MLSATAALIVQAAVTPYFLIVVLPFAVVYYYIQRFIRYAIEFSSDQYYSPDAQCIM